MGPLARLRALEWKFLLTPLGGGCVLAGACIAYATSKSETQGEEHVKALAWFAAAGLLLFTGVLLGCVITKAVALLLGPEVERVLSKPPEVPPKAGQSLFRPGVDDPGMKTASAQVLGIALSAEGIEYSVGMFPADDQVWRIYRDKSVRLADAALRGPVARRWSDIVGVAERQPDAEAKFNSLSESLRNFWSAIGTLDIRQGWDGMWPGDDPPPVLRFAKSKS